jgi:hypothetical protein
VKTSEILGLVAKTGPTALSWVLGLARDLIARPVPRITGLRFKANLADVRRRFKSLTAQTKQVLTENLFAIYLREPPTLHQSICIG